MMAHGRYLVKELDQATGDIHTAYRSEAYWIQWIRQQYPVEQERVHSLGIRVYESNLDSLLNDQCSDIYNDYLQRHLNVGKRMPEIPELCQMYGEPDSEKMYRMGDLERKWIDMHMKEHMQDCLEGHKAGTFLF
jgi:hypothetical protein